MPCLIGALLCVTLLAASPSAAAAEDLVVEAERQGERVSLRARARVVARAALVWQVLTDYERLPSFIPGIKRSHVRARDAQRLFVEQSGEARFLLFTLPIEVRLEVVESPPHSVASRAVGGNLRRMDGCYELQPDEARGTVLLRYAGEIEPDFALPPLVGLYALRLIDRKSVV